MPSLIFDRWVCFTWERRIDVYDLKLLSGIAPPEFRGNCQYFDLSQPALHFCNIWSCAAQLFFSASELHFPLPINGSKERPSP